ncbi:phage tail tape measure protein [Kitasatospora purpeofusca]|uniref:phage tail tape measure protein n=1 Tax=Kitasatospora purpeofusca TaxID=67352 RepID=UPI0022551091|nr:phage tail tape measure protein [Kitasatospora purpeofusca]MCX4687296.1 phage tail tape measure protein [Kitasatospora purpeofusca]
MGAVSMAGGAIRAGTAFVDIRAGDTSHLVSGATDAAREAGQQASAQLEHSIGPEAGGQTGGGFAGKFGGMLKAGLAGAALAAGALLVKGLGDALEQGKLTGRLQASLGATPEVAANAGKVAGQLYASGVTDSFEEATQALSGVMRSGILPPDATNAQLQSITAKVTDLSKTFELDLGQTSNAVGQMLKNGLAKDGTEALDILTKGMQQMGPRADDMADTMNEYSTKFRDLGLSAADAMGLMSQGMAAGARDTDTVADSLKEFQIRATDGSKASTEAYQAIGLNAEEMTKKIAAGGPGAREGLQQVLDGIKGIKDPAERSAVSVGLFGTKAEDMGQALFALDLNTAGKTLGDYAGAADKMGDSLRDNAGTKIESFKRSLMQGVTEAVGTYVIPALERLGSVVGSVLGPAMTAAKGAVDLFIGAFTGEGSDSAIPAGWINPVIEAGATARSMFDALSEKVRGLVDVFKTTMLPAIQGVADVVMNQLLPAYTSVAGAIMNGFMPVIQSVGGFILDTLVPAIMRIYAAIYENVQPVISAFASALQTYVAPAVQRLGEKLNEVWQKAQPVVSVVVSVTEKVAEFAAKILGVVIPPIVRFAGEVLGNLINVLGSVIGWVGDVIGWVVNFGRSVVNAASDAGQFVGKIREHFSSMVSTVKEKIGNAVETVKELPGKIVDGLGNMGSLLVGAGKDVINGLINGIVGMGSQLASKAASVVKDNIPGPIKDILGIHSPSRVTMELGMWTGKGMILGLESTGKEMRRTAEGYAEDIGTALAAPQGAYSGPVGLVGPLGTADFGSASYGAPTASGGGVTVNVKTDASPYEIGRAIAWDARTGGR